MSLSQTALVCTLTKLARPSGSTAPATPLASSKTLRVAAGMTDVTVA